MENNKYFTPNIEDLCIGYELEVNYNFKLNDIFNKKIIDSFEQLADIHSRMVGDCVIRIPYLTKEQIEAEGWKHSEKNCFDFNDRWMCSWYPEHNRIEFYDNENKNGFAGECKDINTFRKIIKLLGI